MIDETEAKKRNEMAKRMFSDPHYGHKRPDPDNCSACAIRMGDADGPNYAGWARLYVEALKPIPVKWLDAFYRELHSDNTAYAGALRESIMYFGCCFIEPKI